MGRYIVSRLLQALLLLLGVSFVTFILIHSAPGMPAVLLAPGVSRAEAQQMAANLGLDQPILVQYLRWLGHVLRGSLGNSLVQYRPVSALIVERFAATLLLSGAALSLAVLLGLPLGLLSALRPRSSLDRLASAWSVIAIALPPFWFGIVLIVVFAVLLRWLPSNGIGDPGNPLDVARHLLLPALVLATPLMGQIVRYTRASAGEILNMTYVWTARSKGMAERRVILRHVLPNTLIPVATVIGLMLPILVGGTPVTEIVFGWPGIGRLAVDAASTRDYPLVMGVTLVIAAGVVVANLLIDLLYVMLDPRVRLGKSA